MRPKNRKKKTREKERKRENGDNCAQVRATSYAQCAQRASFGPVEDQLSSLIAFTFTTTRVYFTCVFGSIESMIGLRMSAVSPFIRF